MKQNEHEKLMKSIDGMHLWNNYEYLARNKNSDALWEKGKKLVINGTSLFSRGPRISVEGVAPKYFSSARGCYFTDVDNNTFLDYGMAVGSVLLGWNYICNGVFKNVSKTGANGTILTPLQVELAEKLHKNIPSCGRLKFLSTGSEATEAAVRVARIYTNKDIILRDHYHGWMSWCVPKRAGVPECYYNLSINMEDASIEEYKELLETKDVACVILEPMKAFDVSIDERARFLSQLKKECHKNDALLIFDEVACGYRFGLGGAQKVLGVTPDISAFGKSIANGYPLSFFCANDDIANEVEGKLFVSSTFGGNPLGLNACLLTTHFMKINNVSSYIGKHGAEIKNGINEMSDEYGLLDVIRVVGSPQRLMWIQKDWDMISLLFQEFIKQNIFFGWEIKNSYSHKDEDIEKTLDAFSIAIKICKEAKTDGNVLKYINGKPLRPIL